MKNYKISEEQIQLVINHLGNIETAWNKVSPVANEIAKFLSQLPEIKDVKKEKAKK